MKSKQLKTVNSVILSNWKALKKKAKAQSKTQEVQQVLKFETLEKKKCPSFTRHNGKKILRLKRKAAWRARKGTKSNFLKGPKIGYRNPSEHRFRKQNGLKIVRVFNLSQIQKSELTRKNYEVYVIAHTVGAKKREELLSYCKEKNLPLALFR
jgi:ribosomal protein L32E